MMIKVESDGEAVEGVAPVSSRNDFALSWSLKLEERAEVGIFVREYRVMSDEEPRNDFRGVETEEEGRQHPRARCGGLFADAGLQSKIFDAFSSPHWSWCMQLCYHSYSPRMLSAFHGMPDVLRAAKLVKDLVRAIRY
jgi:hypothetical protein